MPQLLVLLLAACGTTLATGLGAVPVFMLGSAARSLTPFLLGLAAGVMAVAAVLGLLVPAAEEGSVAELVVGCAIGVAFLVFTSRRFDAEAGFMGRSGESARTSGLVFVVLFVHSPPEGLAIGTAFAFAAGAMLALVASELLPSAYRMRESLQPSAGIALGAALMVALSLSLGV